MLERIPVVVRASDMISERGVKDALQRRAEVCLVEPEAAPAQAVTVVVIRDMGEPLAHVPGTARESGAHRLVVVVDMLDDAGVRAAAAAGVAGLVRRCDATADRLAEAITSAYHAAAVPAGLLERLLAQTERPGERPPRSSRVATTATAALTAREAAVLRLVAAGLDTREIAREMSCSLRTVKSILHEVTSRFHLRNRSHAVAYALRKGLI